MQKIRRERLVLEIRDNYRVEDFQPGMQSVNPVPPEKLVHVQVPVKNENLPKKLTSQRHKGKISHAARVSNPFYDVHVSERKTVRHQVSGTQP